MRRYLVCFDISNNRSRVKAGNILLEYGERVQESVFEVILRRAKDRRELVARLRALEQEPNDPDEDDVFDIRFYKLCHSCQKQSFSLQGETIATSPATIIV